MKNILPFLTLSLILSCKHESEFNLDKDLYQFSEKMENGDTLEVNVDHSACMFAAFETYTFVKQNETLFLEIHSGISSFERKQQTLPKTIYSIKPNDHLSFENYFKYLEKENKRNGERNSSFVTVNYKNKNQIKYFNTYGLGDKFTKLDKLFLVRKTLYPNDKFFETPEPPPPLPKNKKTVPK